MSDNYGPGFTCLPEGKDKKNEPTPEPTPEPDCKDDEYKSNGNCYWCGEGCASCADVSGTCL